MNYTEVTIEIQSVCRDILIAELARYGYDTFEETENGLKAYCPEKEFSEQVLQELQAQYQALFPFLYSAQTIQHTNWNEEWEKNFPPLMISDKVSVRASFHPKPETAAYDIVINPKMSFGTGHHETTTLMIGFQLDLPHEGKHVLDMGCGTGILAIFAAQKGAKKVVAIEIEDWTVENARENAEINNCSAIEVRLGNIDAIRPDEIFDLVLANINRNVLLADMGTYARHMHPGTKLVLSGFYKEDIAQLVQEAEKHGLNLIETRSNNNWAALLFNKN